MTNKASDFISVVFIFIEITGSVYFIFFLTEAPIPLVFRRLLSCLILRCVSVLMAHACLRLYQVV